MIDEYNIGQMNLDQFFNALMQLAQELNEEEQRHVAENLTEEQLTVFDLLTKPEPKVNKDGIEEIKEVANDLLRTLKESDHQLLKCPAVTGGRSVGNTGDS